MKRDFFKDPLTIDEMREELHQAEAEERAIRAENAARRAALENPPVIPSFSSRFFSLPFKILNQLGLLKKPEPSSTNGR